MCLVAASAPSDAQPAADIGPQGAAPGWGDTSEGGNPREMLALRNSKVDLSKWESVSFGLTPPSKVKLLAAQGFVIIDSLFSGLRELHDAIGRPGCC